MLTKRGIVLFVLSIFLFGMGFWMVELTSGSSWVYNYSSGMRTLLEIVPWFLMALGGVGIIGAIAYIIIDRKPLVIRQAKVVEKNGVLILFEFENGRRENLTVSDDTITVGDICEISTKSSFVIDCKKL